jgi:hypothetical protein
MKSLILSTLYNKDNARKKATNALQKTNGFPKVRMFRYNPGKFIPNKINNEYDTNIAYKPKNFLSKQYDFGGSFPSTYNS